MVKYLYARWSEKKQSLARGQSLEINTEPKPQQAVKKKKEVTSVFWNLPTLIVSRIHLPKEERQTEIPFCVESYCI